MGEQQASRGESLDSKMQIHRVSLETQTRASQLARYSFIHSFFTKQHYDKLVSRDEDINKAVLLPQGKRSLIGETDGKNLP